MKKQEIKPLTSFRFLAALAVFAYHLPNWKTGEHNTYLPLGFTGVTFFFILSGFILSYNYADRFKTIQKPLVRDFYLLRFARIYPVHLITFLAFAPFIIGDITKRFSFQNVTAVLANIFAIQSFFPNPDIHFSYNLVSWSISTEFFFYISLPFLLFALSRFEWKSFSLIIAIAVIWSLQATLVMLGLHEKWSGWAFNIFPLFRLGDFILGILLYLIFQRAKKYTEDHPDIWYSLLEIVTLFLLLGSYWLAVGMPRPLLYGVFFSPAMALVILVFAFSRGVLSSFFSNPFLVRLGEISFAFYMIHHVFFWYLDYLHLDFLKHYSFIAAWASLLTVTLLSYLCYQYYEIPAKKWLLKSR